MARVRIHKEDKLPWVCPAAEMPEAERKEFTEGELNAMVRIREEGGDNSPQLIEICYPPHAEIQLHAHDEDEIIFIREGQLLLGNLVLESGTSICVPGKTLYSFRAGPQGLQMLNFRPRKDITFITREEFLRQRESGA